MTTREIMEELRHWSGPEIRIMEVCGTHTAAIMQGGIRSLLPKSITLVSGPGCPVCITPAAYVDKAVELALKEDCRVYSFGDMLKVKGTSMSLSDAKAEGAHVRFIYSPFDLLEIAEKDPGHLHVFAAVGFETTAPVYAVLVTKAMEMGLRNLKILTSLHTVLPALELILGSGEPIAAFIAPGHVSAIIGSDAYHPLAQKYNRPFAVAGFSPEHILLAIFELAHAVRNGQHGVCNLYPGVVRPEGNRKALALIDTVFASGPSAWRGIGIIPDSGLYLGERYSGYDAGSRELPPDPPVNAACRCTDVILGRMHPDGCPLFGTACTPQDAQGPCMVSGEGACGIWHRFRGDVKAD
jgi:hydrogenase expression/formation protein HypD